MVQAPLFVLGHYRSGTTHLHNLLALDPQFAAPTFFQVLNPLHLPDHRAMAAPLADRLVVRRRFQDEVALGAGVPERGRGRPRHDDRPVALHGLVLPQGRVEIRPLPDLPGRPRRGGRPLEDGPDHVPEEADAEARSPAGPQVAAAHRPHPAAPGPLPRRPVRPHPPGPLRRLPLDQAHDPHGPARLPTPGRARPWTATTRSSACTHRDVRRLLRAEGPGPRGAALRRRLRGPGAGAAGRGRLDLRDARVWRASRTSGPAWRPTSARSPAIARTSLDDLPEPLRRRIAHEWGRSFDEWGYGR